MFALIPNPVETLRIDADLYTGPTSFLVIPSEDEGSHPSKLAQTARFTSSVGFASCLHWLRSVGMTMLCFVRYRARRLKSAVTNLIIKYVAASFNLRFFETDQKDLV